MAAPEAPPVSVRIPPWWPIAKRIGDRAPSPSPAAPKAGEKIDGGTLIPLAEREWFCHTCQTASRDDLMRRVGP